MRKFLLSALLIAGGMTIANAQELVFIYDGEALENGASITYEGYTYDTYGYDDYVEYKIDPKIHIMSDVNTEVNIEVSANVEVQLCTIGNCDKSTNPTKTDVPLTADVPRDLVLDWVTELYEEDVDTPFEIPVINMVVKAYPVDAPENVITLNVTMGGVTAGVESLGINNSFVKVTGKTLSYDLASASNLSVYSLSGKTLINKAVSGNGSINLNSLPAGIYLYKVTGKATKAGKFILK